MWFGVISGLTSVKFPDGSLKYFGTNVTILINRAVLASYEQYLGRVSMSR